MKNVMREGREIARSHGWMSMRAASLGAAIVAVTASCMPDFDALLAGNSGGGGTETTSSSSSSTTSSSSSSTTTTSSATSSSSSASASTTTSSSSSSSSGVAFAPITYTFDSDTNGFTVPYAIPMDWMTSVVPMIAGGELVTTIPFTSDSVDAGMGVQEIEIARDMHSTNWTGARTLEIDVQLQASGSASSGFYQGFIQSGPGWALWLSFNTVALASTPGMITLKASLSQDANLDVSTIQRVGVQVKNGAGAVASNTTVAVSISAVKIY